MRALWVGLLLIGCSQAPPKLEPIDPILSELLHRVPTNHQYARSRLLEQFRPGPSDLWRFCWTGQPVGQVGSLPLDDLLRSRLLAQLRVYPEFVPDYVPVLPDEILADPDLAAAIDSRLSCRELILSQDDVRYLRGRLRGAQLRAYVDSISAEQLPLLVCQAFQTLPPDDQQCVVASASRPLKPDVTGRLAYKVQAYVDHLPSLPLCLKLLATPQDQRTGRLLAGRFFASKHDQERTILARTLVGCDWPRRAEFLLRFQQEPEEKVLLQSFDWRTPDSQLEKMVQVRKPCPKALSKLSSQDLRDNLYSALLLYARDPQLVRDCLSLTFVEARDLAGVPGLGRTPIMSSNLSVGACVALTTKGNADDKSLDVELMPKIIPDPSLGGYESNNRICQVMLDSSRDLYTKADWMLETPCPVSDRWLIAQLASPQVEPRWVQEALARRTSLRHLTLPAVAGWRSGVFAVIRGQVDELASILAGPDRNARLAVVTAARDCGVPLPLEPLEASMLEDAELAAATKAYLACVPGPQNRAALRQYWREGNQPGGTGSTGFQQRSLPQLAEFKRLVRQRGGEGYALIGSQTECYYTPWEGRTRELPHFRLDGPGKHEYLLAIAHQGAVKVLYFSDPDPLTEHGWVYLEALSQFKQTNPHHP